jgi:SprT protein
VLQAEAPAETTGSERLRERIASAVAACLRDCEPIARGHGRRLPKPVVRYDLKGQSAGQCIWHVGHRPVLRFNLDIARHHEDHFVRTTVAHEVAHLVTAACYRRAAPHGAQWRAVMRHLGIAEPSRCHDYRIDDAKVRRQRRWIYQCDCMQHALTTTRHNRVQQQLAQYHCRRCGAALRQA